MAIRKIVSRSIGVDVIAAEDLANNSVTVAELSDDAVTSAKIDSTSTGMSLADLAVDTDTLYVDATNNRVGVNTNAPSYQLDVRDSTNGSVVSRIGNTSDGASSQSVIQIATGSSFGRYTNLTTNYTNQYFQISNANIGTSYYDFNTHNFRNSSGTQLARLDSDGLKFNSDTAAANALDDYEEGTYTPTLSGFTPSGGDLYGHYTKIGNLCNVTISYQNFSWTNGGGNIAVSLPFTATSYERQFVNGGSAWYYIVNSGSTTSHMSYYVPASSTNVNLYWSYVNGGTWSEVASNSSNGSSGYFELTISYKTA